MNIALAQTVGERLKSARMQLGFSRREFADKCGFSAATLQAWEDDKYPIPQKSLLKYIKAISECGLYATPDWFYKGEGLPPRFITNSLHFLPEREIILKEINLFEKQNKDAIIHAIKDDAMLPFYGIGDYVGGKIIPMQFVENCIGKICIVTLFSGETFVRTLKKGSQEGRFNLISTNLETNVTNAYLLNCVIEQVATVLWHRKTEPHFY